MEDLAVGQTFGAGPIEVTEDEVIAFAQKFDPQFFHTDPEAAKNSPFGGLIASGWHTAAITMRLIIEASPPMKGGMVGRSVEKEKVTFLGVGTSPVSGTLSAQLGLPKGSGLVVNHIVPDSAAVSTLQEHDILLRLDDQILIETHQLEVLIRNHKEGDEITLTYLRGGKQATAKVKLGQKEVPKISLVEQRGLFPGGAGGVFFGQGQPGSWFEVPAPAPGEARAEYDGVLKLIRPEAGENPVRIQIEHRGGPGLRATSVNVANSNLSFSDDQGSLELTLKDGEKSLVAKDAKGQQIFSGPVTTPEQRQAVPEAVRQRLENLEGMHNITFRTDGDFMGGGAKVMQPAPRGIAFPRIPAPRPPSTPVF